MKNDIVGVTAPKTFLGGRFVCFKPTCRLLRSPPYAAGAGGGCNRWKL